ncbi:hypothetical protein HMPREF1984_01936 [Leptotrichia sp. oral taxon 215 str. W9775]|uniref:hypothetical protein n=1 Tax=Leptotrichia sp. oral taxon 215 TaxID=712359 RepID=UPI0003AE6639|nr:hypothetical protein [Leptotrichia sp. oral taxon 215]ERK65995.1 hypothetical protein HMPREF1984_01936 [Leptotrichia sp. oral taxon 215 str. W9775]
MVEIIYNNEKEYINNENLLKQLKEKGMITSNNYKTIICFFEYNSQEKICFVRELDRNCPSRSEQRKQEVIEKIKKIDDIDNIQPLVSYLEKINGATKIQFVATPDEKKYYFMHCVLIQEPQVQN